MQQNAYTLLLTAFGFNFASANPLLENFRSAMSAKPRLDSRAINRDVTLSDDQWNTFQTEYQAAVVIANKVKGIVTDSNPAWEEFIGDKYQETYIDAYKDDYLTDFAGIGDSTDVTWTIRYGDQTDQGCQETLPDGSKSIAHTENGVTTLCDAWFNFPATADLLQTACAETDFLLDNFESKATILLHEYLHLQTSVPLSPFNQNGEAYGSGNCYELAAEEPDTAITNPDNWMYVALSIYWGDQCGRVIEISPTDADLALCTSGSSPGDPNGWIVSSGDTCTSNGGVTNSVRTISGPECGAPIAGNTEKLQKAECSILDTNPAAVEISLEVTNPDLGEGPFTGYNVTLFTKPDCAGEQVSYAGPMDSVPDGLLYVAGCFSPSSGTWGSFLVNQILLSQ